MTVIDQIRKWANERLTKVESEIAKMYGISASMYQDLTAKRVVLKDLLYFIDQKVEKGEPWEHAYRAWVMGHAEGEALYCKDAWKAAMEWQRKQLIEKTVGFFEDYLTEQDCKFGSSEWTEVKADFETKDDFISAFKHHMED